MPRQDHTTSTQNLQVLEDGMVGDPPPLTTIAIGPLVSNLCSIIAGQVATMLAVLCRGDSKTGRRSQYRSPEVESRHFSRDPEVVLCFADMLFFFGTVFAGGVVLATGFVHILPDAAEAMSNPCLHLSTTYPWAYLVAGGAALVTFMVEYFLKQIIRK